MHQDLPLISTIAVGLSLALVFGLVAAKLRLPPIVGYLLAGMVIGPGTPGYVAHVDVASELAEIGIVLLMFGVGLHFSLKDLMSVRHIALPGAVAQMAAATTMGAILAYTLGWSLPAGVLFGLALSVASTVVLLRSLEDHNLLETKNGRIAIGWLIVEDLAMVLALVLIPALAMPDEGAEGKPPLMLLSIALVKIGLFAAVMLVGGKRILPWMLRVVTKTRSRELFTLSVFAVAIGVAFGASKLFGVSFALGAFFAGMMIRETDVSHEVAKRALPFQDAFAVLFFVAVGMLFNPQTLMEQPLNVLYVVLIITLGKSLVAFIIVLLAGYSLKTGLLVSAGLAQIGEFSFILVALGVTYGILPEEGRDLVLAGAMVSIAINPALFWGVRGLYAFLERDIPRAAAHDLKNHIIVAGYGQCGREVCDNIVDAHLDLVIIDASRERTDMLHELGYRAVAGDATDARILREAGIGTASAIVLCIPDSFEVRRAVETVRGMNPVIRILVRARSDDDFYAFKKHTVDFVTTPHRETGRAMIAYLNDLREP